jgi:two-component system phosphate regulon response regulator PhoB
MSTKHGIKPSVLVVEDDQSIVTLLQYTLEKEGYEVRTTDDGDEAFLLAQERKPDLIILDWMLPGLSGVQICEHFRSDKETTTIPIIMLSARGEEGDRVEGLDRGADDYLTKPFSPKELVSRINAVFRRIRPAFAAKELVFGDIRMDLVTKQTFKGRALVHLGPIEYRLLQSLMEYPKRVLSREQLIRRVWGDELYVEPRTVDVHVNRLRKALSLQKDIGTTIKTVRAAGYCIKDSDSIDI